MNYRFLLLIGLLLPLVAKSQSLAPVPSQNIVAFNNHVLTALPLDNSLLVGGRFAKCAEYNSGIVAVSPVSGEAIPSIHFPNGFLEVISDNVGGWYALTPPTPPFKSGSALLQHLAPNGAIRKVMPLTVDSVGLSHGFIRCMAIAGDTVFIGGYFSGINGVERRSIAAIHLTTGELLPFNPTADSTVESMAVYGPDLLVAGEFGTITGESRTALARINRETGALHDWPTMPTHLMRRNFPDLFNHYEKLVVSKDVLYTKRGSMNLITGERTSWNPVVSTPYPDFVGAIHDVDVWDGKIIAVGEFLTANGQSRNGVAIYDEATGEILPTAVNTKWIDPYDQRIPFISSVRVVDSIIYVAGALRHADSTPIDGIAAFSLVTGELKSEWKVRCLKPQPGADISAYVEYADRNAVFVGCPYGATGVPLYERTGIVELSAAGDKVLDWNVQMKNLRGSRDSDTTPQVHAMIGTAERIYIAGGFDSVQGEPRTSLCAFNRTTRQLLPWSPKIVGYYVNKIVIDKGTMYFSGDFDSVNGKRQRFIGAVDAVTGESRLLDLTVDSTITAMEIRDGKMYIGGYFRKVNDSERNGFAVIDGSSGVLLEEGPKFPKSATISTMLMTDSVLYLSGKRMGSEVTPIAHPGSGRGALAGYDRITGEVKWMPKYDTPTNVGAISISLYGGKLLVTGNKRIEVNGETFFGNSVGIFYYDLTTGREVEGVITGHNIRILTLSKDTVFVTGNFSEAKVWPGMIFFGRYDPQRSTGVSPAEPQKGSRIALWPNPTRGMVTVQTPSGRGGVLQVFNISGNAVGEYTVGDQSTINVGHLPTGQYLVRIGGETAPLTITH